MRVWIDPFQLNSSVLLLVYQLLQHQEQHTVPLVSR